MKKFLVLFMTLPLLILSGCSKDESVYRFKPRRDGEFISSNELVVIKYKTNDLGELIKIEIDRLLSIEDIIYLNPTIDKFLKYINIDVYVDAGNNCTSYEDLKVPLNIEISNSRFKYSRAFCKYLEVDRDNSFKTGAFNEEYTLFDTINYSFDTFVKVLVYDESSVQKFIQLDYLPHTQKGLSVFSIKILEDEKNYPLSHEFNVYKSHMKIYEQLLLKYQENESVLSQISGISGDIDIFNLANLEDIKPMIDNFEVEYDLEIEAFEEFVIEVGVYPQEEVETTDMSEENYNDSFSLLN